MIQTTLPPMVQCMASLVLTNGHVLHVSHLNDATEGHPLHAGGQSYTCAALGFVVGGSPNPMCGLVEIAEPIC